METGEHVSDELGEARAAIDEVDREMARLFAVRMDAVAKVAAYKRSQGLPVRDARREAAVIERGAQLVREELRPYYERFQKGAIEAACQYQQHLMG